MTHVLLLAAFTWLSGAAAAPAVIEGFRFEPERQPVGRVYEYRKSNIDGTRASRVDLYIASPTRLESFKWHEGGSQATLVVAEMDWTTFSVARFEAYRIHPGGRRERMAFLQQSDDRAYLAGEARGNAFRAAVPRHPWHSYDFDLASLNAALRYLTDPEGSVSFGIMDVTPSGFGAKGDVELRFTGTEAREDIDCRRYSIDGPGLENRGGRIWVRRGDDPVVVDFEIDLPDEPGMQSGKLTLLGQRELGTEAWADHLAGKVN